MIRNYVKGMVLAKHVACIGTIRIVIQTIQNKIDQGFRKVIWINTPKPKHGI